MLKCSFKSAVPPKLSILIEGDSYSADKISACNHMREFIFCNPKSASKSIISWPGSTEQAQPMVPYPGSIIVILYPIIQAVGFNPLAWASSPVKC